MQNTGIASKTGGGLARFLSGKGFRVGFNLGHCKSSSRHQRGGRSNPADENKKSWILSGLRPQNDDIRNIYPRPTGEGGRRPGEGAVPRHCGCTRSNDVLRSLPCKGRCREATEGLTPEPIPPQSPLCKGGKAAFTLAEVLITLGIIGVVAAITMPTLVQKNQEKVTVTKLKKFMSVMNSAIQMAVNEHGPIETWSFTQSDYDEEKDSGSEESRAGIDYFLQTYIVPYVKHTKYCPYTDSSCYVYDRYSLDGTKFSFFTERLMLADGVIVGVWIENPSCTSNFGDSKQLQNVCGQIFYDTNGRKGPNKTGVDVFLFYFTKYGVIPVGTALETSNSTFDNQCNLSNTHRFNGYGCTAWVIYNENMDYLKCNDLSWDGKKNCSD